MLGILSAVICGLFIGATLRAQITKVRLPLTKPAIAPYLQNQPQELYVYAHTDRPVSEWTAVNAPAADMRTARSYALYAKKGRAVNGYRATILTAKTHYAPGEPVRVIHVLDVTKPGAMVYVMGPKDIINEYVDGRLASPGPPDAIRYGGTVLTAPQADFNYQISVYRFAKPGVHTIQWRGAGFYEGCLGSQSSALKEGCLGLRSNTLKIVVAPPAPPHG